MIDAFLELVGSTGTMIEGESTDRTFVKLIEIRDFGMGDKVTLSPPKPPTDPNDPAKPGTGPVAHPKDLADQMAVQIDDRLAKINKELEARRSSSSRTRPPSSGPRLDQLKTLVADQVTQQQEQADAPSDQKRMKFSILKDIDASSADLFQASCATAKAPQTVEKNRQMGEFESATITLRKMFDGEPKPYLVCTFKGVAIESYSLSYDSGRAHMYEKVSFLFEDYKIDYKLQTAAGVVAAANPVKEGTLGKKSGA